MTPAIDLVFMFDTEPISSGTWVYSHCMYIPSGFSGYFNVQTDPAPGIGWNLEVNFDDNGTGYLEGQSTQTFIYDQDTWSFVQVNYDLESGWAEVLIDGDEIAQFQNTMTIGGINYYGATGGGQPGAFYDNVCIFEGYGCPEPPTNLVATVIEPDDVQLSWDSPGSGSVNYDSFGKKDNSTIGKSLIGYKVYRDGVFVEFTADTSYLDENLSPGSYDYYVTALYNAGESMPSNIETVIIENTICEDFDDLNVGGGVAEQLGGDWLTWSGLPTHDATVVDDNSYSPNNSFIVDSPDVDLVRQLGNDPISDDQWLYSHYMYVPSGYSGYFNVQTVPAPGVGWNMEFYFNDGGTGSFTGQGLTHEFIYNQDAWILVEVNYDFVSGWAEIKFDGSLMFQFENTMTIGGIDFYGADTGGPPGAYYDDVCFGEGYEIIPPGPCEDFDDLTVGGYLIQQLGGYWIYFGSGAPGWGDAIVVDDNSYSPENSFVVNLNSIDIVFQLGDEAITTGQWLYSHYMYVPSGFSGYFNVQEDPEPGVGWNLEIYFDDDGTGYFEGQSTETFVYEMDTWFMVEVNYDFESGWAVVLFDGEAILYFENTPTIGGINYYGSDIGGSPGAYYDDVCFSEGWVITGIEDVTVNNTMVYPNPTTDVVNIKSDFVIESIIVYNTTGQIIATEQANDKQIKVNLSQYNPGIYLLRIETEKGVISKRIIIE